jgi:hypothetical protein
VQAGSDPAVVAVLGEGSDVKKACEDLSGDASLNCSEDRCFKHFFLVHFTMREAWDLPQDDELAEASVGSDWIDLGCQLNDGGISSIDMEDEDDDSQAVPRSPQSVLRRRLREVLADQEDLYVFMDENPFASSQIGTVRVDFAGVLPRSWDAVHRAVLACEAHGVYLSHRFEVLFWPPAELKERLEHEVQNALGHCKASAEYLRKGRDGFGLAATGVSGFEALAENVSAVLSGYSPPGWERLEWTPHSSLAAPPHAE